MRGGFLWRQETALRIAGKGVGRESAAALFFLGNWELVSNSSLLSTDAPGRIDGKVTSCRGEGFARAKTKLFKNRSIAAKDKSAFFAISQLQIWRI